MEGLAMSRRGENIYKRKDGRWEGRYIKGRNLENKAKYGYVYGKSYSAVREKLKSVSANKNIPEKCKTELFYKIANDWYDLKKINVKESTLARYRSLLDNHVIPLLGSFDIKAISVEVIQGYLNKLINSGYSAKTANDILTVIKNIFKYARLNNIEINTALDSICVKIQKNSIDILTAFEEKQLCNYLLKNMDNKNFGILLCLCTGIRIGEICALKWSDINVKERLVEINKTMIRIQRNSKNISGKTEVIITEPKSENSKRNIPISDIMIKVVKSFNRNNSAFVLTGLTNKYIEPRNMQYYFKSVLKKCGIKNYKFHVLRHTFATRCVENGVEIKSLSEILGHSSIKITLDKYVHSSMELKRKEMEKINILSA